MEKLDPELAQRVVETVKSVCGNDINYISPSGTVFASTDPKRVDTFHEAGRIAAQQRKTVEVTADDQYLGSQIGVNFPYFYHGAVRAVIGITGQPVKVRKYAQLAERITNLLVRERELQAVSVNQADKRRYVLDCLLQDREQDFAYLNQCFQELHIDPNTPKRLVLLRALETEGNRTFSAFDQSLRSLLTQKGIMLYAFLFPNSYAIVLDEAQFQRELSFIHQKTAQYEEVFRVTAGTKCTIYELRQSYDTAKTAMNSLLPQNGRLILFDDLTLDILLSDIRPSKRELFLEKTAKKLTAEEISILRVYFQYNQSLQETGKRLYIHKNTLQYKLNGIARKTGFNPRQFTDGVILWLAMQIDAYRV